MCSAGAKVGGRCCKVALLSRPPCQISVFTLLCHLQCARLCLFVPSLNHQPRTTYNTEQAPARFQRLVPQGGEHLFSKGRGRPESLFLGRFGILSLVNSNNPSGRPSASRQLSGVPGTMARWSEVIRAEISSADRSLINPCWSWAKHPKSRCPTGVDGIHTAMRHPDRKCRATELHYCHQAPVREQGPPRSLVAILGPSHSLMPSTRKGSAHAAAWG